MPVRNQEVQSESKICSSQISSLTVGDQVAAGHTRWVTFIALDAILAANTESMRLIFASVDSATPTTSALIATSNRKYLVDLRASKLLSLTPDGVPFMVPRQPDVNKPLFSIGSEAYLGVYASSISSNLFVQYFDE